MRWTYRQLALATAVSAALVKYWYRSPSFASTAKQQFDASLPNPALQLLVSLKTSHPHSQHVTVVESHHVQFPVFAYLNATRVPCTALDAETHNAYVYDQNQRVVTTVPITKVTTFTHEDILFRVFEAAWTRGHEPLRFFDYVFDALDDSAGRRLLAASHEWATSLQEEMWVFEGGEWSKSKTLFRAVQSASWDDIVLDERFREGLRRDTETFFASKETYKSLGVGWKRGLLLLGPPGNGKTESIKALLREFSHYSALYVKSINSHMGPEYGVHSVFEHARKHSPCILVLEDLDSMIIDRIRSFFLNELDGLAENEGILTIATTNHPEDIDDAILNRPSRFDVKYNFAIPSFQLRAEFAAMWLRKIHALDGGMIFHRPDAELAKSIAEQTEEWSFAFLKELFVSFLLRVAHDKSLETSSGTPLDDVLLDQVDKLAPQVLITKDDAFDDARSTGPPMVHRELPFVRLPSGMMHARPLSL